MAVIRSSLRYLVDLIQRIVQTYAATAIDIERQRGVTHRLEGQKGEGVVTSSAGPSGYQLRLLRQLAHPGGIAAGGDQRQVRVPLAQPGRRIGYTRARFELYGNRVVLDGTRSTQPYRATGKEQCQQRKSQRSHAFPQKWIVTSKGRWSDASVVTTSARVQPDPRRSR